MKDEFDEIIVSTKHVKRRTIFLIIAVITAITAFAIGIGSLTHKEEGYYQIEASLPEEASHAGNGIALTLYLKGESGDIRDALNRAKDLYAAELTRSYKLLDEKQKYEGYTNIASINSSIGKSVEVSNELMEILLDADRKSREGNNFNLYANCLTEEWDSILSLSEPEEYDPSRNQDSEERIRQLSLLCNDLTQFSLTSEKGKDQRITAMISDAFLNALKEMEIEGNILGLGRLKEAYRLDLIRKALEAEGFTDGYITTNNGLSVALKDYEKGILTFYGSAEGQPKQMAAVRIPQGGACVMLRAFPMNQSEALYYQIDAGEKTLYRSPWFSVKTGENSSALSSCAVLSEDGDIIKTMLTALNLFTEDGTKIEKNAENSEDIIIWTLQSEKEILYTNTPEFEAVAGTVEIKEIS